MLKLISYTIATGPSANSINEFAENVLAAIEAAGMLPASFYWSTTGEYRPAKEATDYFGALEFGRFEWEPETAESDKP